MALVHLVKYLLVSWLGLSLGPNSPAQPTDLLEASACERVECDNWCRIITDNKASGQCVYGQCNCLEAPLAATACKKDACDKYCREIAGGSYYGECYNGNCSCNRRAPPAETTEHPSAESGCRPEACQRHCREVTGGRQNGRCEDNWCTCR